MTVVDIELDMDFMDELADMSAIPCEYYEKCELEAQWYDVLSCCADTLILCQEHQDALDAVLMKMPIIVCGVCNSVVKSSEAITIKDRL